MQSKCHQKTVELRVWKSHTGRWLSSYPIRLKSILDDPEEISDTPNKVLSGLCLFHRSQWPLLVRVLLLLPLPVLYLKEHVSKQKLPRSAAGDADSRIRPLLRSRSRASRRRSRRGRPLADGQRGQSPPRAPAALRRGPLLPCPARCRRARGASSRYFAQNFWARRP